MSYDPNHQLEPTPELIATAMRRQGAHERLRLPAKRGCVGRVPASPHRFRA